MSDVFRTFTYELKHPKGAVRILTRVKSSVSRHEHMVSLDFDGSYAGPQPQLSKESTEKLSTELEALTFLKPFEPSAELVAMILKDVDDHLRVNVMVPLEMREWPEVQPGSFDLGMHTSSVGAAYFVEHLGETFELCWYRHISSGDLSHVVEFHLALQQSDPREARVWTPPYELQHEIGEWLHKAGQDVSSIPANIEAALRAAAVAMLDQQVGSTTV